MIAAFLVGPRDSIRLDTFRMVTGVVLVGYMAHWWLDDAVEWLTVAGFHLSRTATGPGWLSLPPLPLWALAPFGLVFFVALLAFTCGFRLPWSAGVVLLFTIYVSHVDPLASFTPNNLLIPTLAVLTAAPRGRYWTLDQVPPRVPSVWPVRVLQAMLLVIYFTAATCKALFGPWLSDSFVLYSQLNGPYRTATGAWLLSRLPAEAWTLFQSLSLAFELLAPVLFTVRRLRVLGYLWGALMHTAIALTMNEFGYFSLQMVCFYTLFMEDATLHTLRARVGAIGRLTLRHRFQPAS